MGETRRKRTSQIGVPWKRKSSEQAETMCKELLANPVIEDFAIEIMPSD